jgi:hypothetical protein
MSCQQIKALLPGEPATLKNVDSKWLFFKELAKNTKQLRPAAFTKIILKASQDCLFN